MAFFTGDDPPVAHHWGKHWGVIPMQSVWSYPGDDPRGGNGRPFDHSIVIMRVHEPAEADEGSTTGRLGAENLGVAAPARTRTRMAAWRRSWRHDDALCVWTSDGVPGRSG